MSKYFYYDKVEAAEEPKRKGGKQKSKKRIPTSRPAREDTASKGRAADKAGELRNALLLAWRTGTAPLIQTPMDSSPSTRVSRTKLS